MLCKEQSNDWADTNFRGPIPLFIGVCLLSQCDNPYMKTLKAGAAKYLAENVLSTNGYKPSKVIAPVYGKLLDREKYSGGSVIYANTDGTDNSFDPVSQGVAILPDGLEIVDFSDEAGDIIEAGYSPKLSDEQATLLVNQGEAMVDDDWVEAFVDKV